MALKNCPKCDKKLPPPFPSTGRQVCSGCGWSDKKNEPKTITTEPIQKYNLSKSSESKLKNSSPLEQIPAEQISSK